MWEQTLKQYQCGSYTQPWAYHIDIKTGSWIHRVHKTFILYTIHRDNIHEQSKFPRSFIFVFNSTIDSLYLIDWGKLFQSRHALPLDKTHLHAVRGLILPRGFHLAHQQVELVGAMPLRSASTNRSA